MTNLIKKLITQQLYNKGLTINPLTAKENIKSLMFKLHPVKTSVPLVRIGSEGDGGYLVPNDLAGIVACFSPGVDKISKFEEDCFKLGQEIYMADKSVDSPITNIPLDKYNFIKKFVGCTSNNDYITMDQWVDSCVSNNNAELLLQMDIEGAEYSTLIATSDKLMKRFRILIVEFHSLQNLWDPFFFEIANIVFDKILQTHYCVHIHPNNCCGMDVKLGLEIPKVAEFTFLRKDRESNVTYAKKFPHELDRNNTSNDEIILPDCWIRF